MTLRIAIVEGDAYAPLRTPIAEWTDATGVPVEIIEKKRPELLTHLRLALQGDPQYDLVSVESEYVPHLAPYLMPLDALLAPEVAADFAAPALEMCRWEGRLLALPRSVETRLLYYRPDIFEDRREREWFREASDGRELDVPRSWEELAVTAQFFTRAGKMHGVAFPGRGPGLLRTFAEITTAMGGTFLDPDGTPQFLSPAGEWALTLLRDLYHRWKAVPEETTYMDPDDVSETFRMGRVAAILDWPGTAHLLCDPTFSAVPGWHSVALAPAGPSGQRAAWTGCPAFAIPAASGQAESALRLLEWLTGDERQRREAKDGAIPARLSAYRAVREDLRDGTLAHLRFTLVEQTLRSARLTAPRIPEFPELEERVWPLLQHAMVGGGEPLEVLELADAAVREALRHQSV